MKALSARPGAPRRIRSVPAIYRGPDDAAEGADVLLEHPGPLGVALCFALRDVSLWLHTHAAERAGLFGPAAGEARRVALEAARNHPDLWAPLLTLAQMADAPARADRVRLVHAVRSIARWAGDAGAPATRLAFTQVAAEALPDQPAPALDAARQARELARHPQAEAWFRRAIRVARGKDWESYAWGFVGMGVLYMRAGNFPAARAVMSRALRAARKRRLRGIAGAAHHHLFVFSADAGRMDEAYQHAHAALHAYGAGHPRVPALAHDLGAIWVDRGHFVRALPVVEAALPLLRDPAERAMAMANVVRASAGAGDRARYERARAEVAAVLRDPAFGPVAAEALLVVAHGDSSLGEWARAEEAARHAATLAQGRGEARIRMVAEAQHDAARAERLRAAAAPGRVPEPEPEVLAAQANTLALEIHVTLGRRVREAVAA